MKNTILLVEPRPNTFCINLLNQYIKILGTDKWNYIFYFGKGTLNLWNSIDKSIVELRELPVSNFANPNEYNDFMKQKILWESLPGEFILSIQLDTWVFENTGYTIDYFLELNKSFIGGNMSSEWFELQRERLHFHYLNFNGGLSLRKRNDMIRVCDSFPPKPTTYPSNCLETDAEDVYFTVGCYRLGLPIGDDEESSHFSIHRIYKTPFFGIHQAYQHAQIELDRIYPELRSINPHLFL